MSDEQGQQNGLHRARNRSVCLHQYLGDSCAGAEERTGLRGSAVHDTATPS